MTALAEAPPLYSVPVATPPRYLIKPPGLTVGADAFEALEFAERIGVRLDDWQQLILAESLAVNDAGYWGLDEIDITVPRQNGKNDVVAVREVYGIVVLGERKIVHTAHQTRTLIEHQERLVEIIESCPSLKKLAPRILTGNNDRSIKFRNGAAINFAIRSKKSGRGFAGDLVVIDEAQDVSDRSVAAILPSGAARPEGQRWVMGTVPGPDVDGEYFKRLRHNSLAGGRAAALWIEWGASAGIDLDDQTTWLAVNPAAPHRMTVRAIASERESLSDEDFGRERLGIWDGGVRTQSPFDAAAMELAFDAESRTDATGKSLTVGIDAAPDRSTAAITIAGRREDDNIHTEVIAHRRGVDWLEAVALGVAAKQRGCTFVIDRAGPAAFLIDVLVSKGHRVVGTSETDMGTACGLYFDRLHGGILKHIGQPDLVSAADNARKRSISGGKQWALTRATSASDITPIVSSVLAVFGLTPGAVRREVKSPSTGRRPAARKLYTFR